MPSLMPFQLECVEKLLTQQGTIIGDDMGLGKTVEAIGLDAARRQRYLKPPEKKTLIICPLGVISSWVDHFAEWQPGLKVCSIDVKNRQPFVDAVTAGSFDVYVMHWDGIRLIPELAKRTWFHIIADEAHRIGNRDTQVTVATKKLPAYFITQLSGTPATAKPDQFWSLLNWIKPKEFSSYWRFYNHHVRFVVHNVGSCNVEDCNKWHKTQFKVITGVAHLEELHKQIGPYFIRRLKEDVIKDLPEKTYTKIYTDLHPQQRRIYNEMRDDMLAWVGENQDQPLAAAQVVAKLARLQQAAIAYMHIERLPAKRRHMHHRKCTSDCKQVWDHIERDYVRLTDPSSKLDVLMELMRDNFEQQFVVFSQSKAAINLLGQRLTKAKESFGLFTGDTEQSDRADLVRDFQAKRKRIFAGTIQAGGEGITLTASSTAVFLDRTWSPAKNRQAEDRIHRIGQRFPVQIIDILARDTVDRGKNQKLHISWHYLKAMLGDKDVPDWATWLEDSEDEE